MTDEQLIEGCTKGDPKAQRHLYDKYVNKMMGVCMRYAHNPEETQDILQDAFVKVFEKIRDYKASGSLEGWIRRVFVNTAIDAHRKNKALRQQTDLKALEFRLKAENYILETLAAKDLLKLIRTLPEGYRMVFNMYAIEGYSHKEIAAKLDISVSTSKSQYSRAKAFIRRMLEKQEILFET